MALTQSKRVLDFHGVVNGNALFGITNEDTGLKRTILYVRDTDFVDMDEPDQITVTIVPGDELND